MSSTAGTLRAKQSVKECLAETKYYRVYKFLFSDPIPHIRLEGLFKHFSNNMLIWKIVAQQSRI